MDSVGVISLVIDVSKDLYTYYRAVRDCDKDIKELRTQLLLLHHTASSLTAALKRDGLSTEDKSQVDLAFTKCEDAAKELKSALERIKIDGVPATTALEKVKAVGRKAAYPFRKSTIEDLAEDVKSCQDALQVAVAVLQLNVGATTVEQIAKLDEKLVAGTTTIESGLKDALVAIDTGKVEIVEHLLQSQKILLQDRKMLEEEGNRKKAMTIVDSLKYPEMTDRAWQIHAADDSTLGDLFTSEESKHHHQVISLLKFLEGGSGLFWIQGKPASGKSTLMKYLLSRSSGADKLWTCSDTREIIFVSHFCWVAGSTSQRSLQGLLQSVLYQVLQADLALVPVACPSRWSSGSSPTQWHEKELWSCLFAAVQASDKRFYFFIDGLDELQPERDHILVSKALNRLSSHINVKLVVSSRPWAAFERNLEHDNRIFTMQENNRLAIIRYIRNELDTHSTDEAFTQVAWDCINENPDGCPPIHHHGEAHDLAARIARRANGVFLWVVLVMKAVCWHIALRCPVSVLNSYVDKLPTELGDYFQSMIFKRIHDSMLSETAMALSIALTDPSNITLSHYALLCKYKDTGVPWLTDPDFASNMPCTTITPAEVTAISRRTINFLRVSCRDILNCRMPDPTEPGRRWFHIIIDRAPVDFVHRTMFDYLHTPEMQLLLAKHTPDRFKDAFFPRDLDLAVCKTVVIDPCDVVCPDAGWYALRQSAIRFTKRDPSEGDVPESSRRYCTSGDIPHFRRSFESLQILEGVCLYHLRAAEGLLSTASTNARSEIRSNCMRLSVELAMQGLFAFTDALMDVAPQLLGSSDQTEYIIRKMMFQLGCHDMTFDLNILRRLFQAGVDPNGWDETQASAPWRTFLARLTETKETTYVVLRQGKELVAYAGSFHADDVSDIGVIATNEEVFANTYLQDAIKTFVEFGAELRTEEAEMLTKYLPKPDGNNFNWPEFFTAYSQSVKRIEVEEDRRERLRRWPESWLTREERRIVNLRPDLSEEWWSDRGRDCLN
jgi:hypothetical protein